MITVYSFGIPISGVTTMGIEGFWPTIRLILADGNPEVAGRLLIVNVAVESSTVAVTVVLAVAFGAATL